MRRPYNSCGRVLCIALPPVGNAHRAFRGGKHGRMPFGRATDNHKIDEKSQCNYFNPCNARPSNAHTVSVFTFMVAVGAGAPTLQFVRSGVVHFFTACDGKHGRMPCGRVLCIALPLTGNAVPISLHRPDGFRFPPVRVVRIITHPLRRFLP